MTHTPGPWYCNLHDWANVYANGGALVAIAKHDGHITENQTLIAAAPELLEALKLLAIAKYKGPAHLTEALWEQAYAAIAKAEGKQ